VQFPVAIFAFAFLGWTFDFYDLVLLGFIKGPVARDLAMSPSTEWWLLGAGLGASGIGGLVAGALSDRYGKRRVLAATVLVYSIGSLACGLAPTAGAFFAGRVFQGLGVGGEWAIGHGMLAEAVAPRIRGRAAAALQTGEPVGVALAALVGYLVLPRVGWRAVLIGSSVTALLAVAARLSAHLPDRPATGKSFFGQLATAVRVPGLGRRFGAAWLLGVFKLGTYWSCYTWLPTFLSTHMKQGVGRSLTWMITAQAGQLGGMLTFGLVSDRLGRRPAFAIFSVLTAVAVGTLALAWAELLGRPVLFWTVMFSLGVGSGCTAGFGALLAELYPAELRGAAMGATYNLARMAQIATPFAVGLAVAHAGLTGGLAVPCVLALATAAWVWVLPETRGIPLPELEPTATTGVARRGIIQS
jgi:MFS family permease